MNKSVIGRSSWVHWLLAVVYGLLATGTFFKFSYEIGALFNSHFWAGVVYASSPAWAQIMMGIQTWAFVSLVGFSILTTGSPTLPHPPLKNR